MMTKLELAPFTATEMNYIKEYCKVSEPVAVALDMLQGEAQAYFGTLLPTIIVAKQMLDAMINTRGELQHCKDYAKALLEGLNKRFKHLESDEKCLLAEAFHPKFRQLLWLSEEKRPGLKKKMEDDDFQRERSLMDLFIEFNTPVPSSAGVERLFSQAGDILHPKRCSLTEDRFHQLMFMRGNRHHWETYKED